MGIEPFVAEIMMFSGNFAPRFWATTDGQLLAIAQNTALFSLLGTTYGGNGQSNFALPNLRDRSPMFWGQGPGLTSRVIGESGGSATAPLVSVTTAAAPPAPMQAITFNPSGLSTASPFLTLTFVIALQGIYPSRP